MRDTPRLLATTTKAMTATIDTLSAEMYMRSLTTGQVARAIGQCFASFVIAHRDILPRGFRLSRRHATAPASS